MIASERHAGRGRYACEPRGRMVLKPIRRWTSGTTPTITLDSNTFDREPGQDRHAPVSLYRSGPQKAQSTQAAIPRPA